MAMQRNVLSFQIVPWKSMLPTIWVVPCQVLTRRGFPQQRNVGRSVNAATPMRNSSLGVVSLGNLAVVSAMMPEEVLGSRQPFRMFPGLSEVAAVLVSG